MLPKRLLPQAGPHLFHSQRIHPSKQNCASEMKGLLKKYIFLALRDVKKTFTTHMD